MFNLQGISYSMHDTQSCRRTLFLEKMPSSSLNLRNYRWASSTGQCQFIHCSPTISKHNISFCQLLKNKQKKQQLYLRKTPLRLYSRSPPAWTWMSGVTTGLQSSLLTAPAGGPCSGMQVLLLEQTAAASPLWVCVVSWKCGRDCQSCVTFLQTLLFSSVVCFDSSIIWRSDQIGSVIHRRVAQIKQRGAFVCVAFLLKKQIRVSGLCK